MSFSANAASIVPSERTTSAASRVRRSSTWRPAEHRGEDFLHARDRNVREEAQAALVDPDERNFERRQAPRDREHRAVAAEDDRDVGLYPEIRCRRRREIGRPSSVQCRPRSPRRVRE
jgi:hypothetical protein